MIPLKLAMVIRGTIKIALVAFLTNQLLTTIFSYVARQVDPSIPVSTISIFSFATCGLVAFWLQADARRAYAFARAKGHVKPVSQTNQALHIAVDCPKRWLVVLHVELNPAAAGL